MPRLILLVTLLFALTITATAQTLSDNFNDGVPDNSKWIVGTGFSNDAINYYPSLVASVENGALSFTLSGGLLFWAGNAYMSQSNFDLRNKRTSALLDASGGLQVWVAIGQNATHFARIEAVTGYDGSRYVQCDYSNGSKVHNLVCVQPADYGADDTYLAIRVQGNKIIFESSPDALTWTERWSVVGAPFANPTRVEVGGGGFYPMDGVRSGIIDNLLVK